MKDKLKELSSDELLELKQLVVNELISRKDVCLLIGEYKNINFKKRCTLDKLKYLCKAIYTNPTKFGIDDDLTFEYLKFNFIMFPDKTEKTVYEYLELSKYLMMH